MVTAFGSLFANTTLVRYNPDGSEQERLIVPIAFGQKEKYIQILEGDPYDDKNIQITLPIMSFSLDGIAYDTSRKLQTTGLNTNRVNDSMASVYNPVPYNFMFSLVIYVRNIEDGAQIVEQILPFFTPDYTLRMDVLPDVGATKDIPIILDSVDYKVDNEGPKDSSTRTVVWTLNFTMKGWIYGPIKSGGGLITEVIVNFYDWDGADGTRHLFLVLGPGGLGTYQPGEIVYQGTALESSKASAVVVSWAPTLNRLEVVNTIGRFMTNTPLIGSINHGSFDLVNYEIRPIPLETLIITGDASTRLGQTFTLGSSPIGRTMATSPNEPFVYDIEHISYGDE